MNVKSLLRFAVAGLVATQLPLLTAQTSLAQSADSVGSFQCKTEGNSYVTVAISKNGAFSKPMIAWTTEEFSEAGYTPQRRCEEVTSRLNNVLSKNGGTLNGLWLTGGRLPNGSFVLCSVNKNNAGCNSDNVLFTLKRGNNPDNLLASLSKVTGTPLQESAGQSYVPLEQLVNQLFK